MQAGLFSAILTAFNVESYQLLRPGTPDPTTIALQQISLQLRSFAISPPFVNSTHHTGESVLSTVTSAPPPVLLSSIWLNILWFSALILSLASTVIGILAKQWLSEYSSGLTGTSREAARLRQYRLNNLGKWYVGDIIAVIPMLLLFSLYLFLAGLLLLLWTLHPAVASVASVLVGILTIFTNGANTMPLFNDGCAYITPQGFLMHAVLKNIVVPSISYPLPRELKSFIDWYFQIIRRLLGIDHLQVGTWRGRERSAVNRLSEALDIDILIKAYDCTLDANTVSSASITLLDQSVECVLDYFLRLDSSIVGHFGAEPLWATPQDELLVCQVLFCALDGKTMDVLPDVWKRILSRSQYYLPSSPRCSPDGTAQLLSGPEKWIQQATSWYASRGLQLPSSCAGGIQAFSTLSKRYEHLDHGKLHTEGNSESNPFRLGEQWRELTFLLAFSVVLLTLNLFTDLSPHTLSEVDVLHTKTLMCLRSLTMAVKIRRHAQKGATSTRQIVHFLDQYLHSVDKFLQCIAATHTAANPMDPQTSGAITREVLSQLIDFLHGLRLPKNTRPLASTYLDHLCSIVDCLKDNYAVFKPLLENPKLLVRTCRELHGYLKLLYYWNPDFRVVFKFDTREFGVVVEEIEPRALSKFRLAILALGVKYD